MGKHDGKATIDKGWVSIHKSPTQEMYQSEAHGSGDDGKKDGWYITNSKSVTCPRHFIKCSGLESSGFLCAGSAKISCLKARCQLTHRSRTTRPLLSTMCFPRVVSGKLTLLFQVLMRWNPKPFNLWRNLSQIARSKPVPLQVPLLARHPPQVLQLRNVGNLKPPVVSTSLGRVNVYQLPCYSYDMLDAS